MTTQQEAIEKMWSRRRRRFLAGLLAGISVGTLACIAFCLGLLSTLQLQSTDFFFRAPDASAREAGDGRIVVVAIDDRSLGALGLFSSWPRSYYADLIDVVHQAGARVVVLDVLFAEPGAGDDELVGSLQRAGNVILPLAYTSQQYGSASASESTGASEFVRPLIMFEREAIAVGHASLLPDSDGVVRKLPVTLGSSEEPALAIAAVAKYLRRPGVIESPVHDGYLPFAGRSIPVDSAHAMIINYCSGAGGSGNPAAFATVSFVDALEGRVDPAVFQDKIVLVGATASALGDTFWTPAGRMENGVEIHASAMQTVLSGEFLRPASSAATIALMLVLAALGSLAVLRLRVLWATLVVAASCAIYLLAALLLFDRGLMLNMVYPPMALLGAFVGVNLLSIASERSQKRAIERTFGRYVSPPVASEIMSALDRGEMELGGQLREATVAFADARGFTSLAEKVEPNELVRVMNVYLSEVIKAVLKYGGMVNKFGGDSILAVWNAPMPCEQHALLAVKASIEAQREIERAKREDESLPRISFGIGINTGEVVAGNMGSEDRLEYSVLGDTVNVAAKLTGAVEGGRVWVTSDTFERIRGRVTAEPLEAVAVKGKSEPIMAYEVRAIRE